MFVILFVIWGIFCVLGIIGYVVGRSIRLFLILIFIGLVGCYGVILISYGIFLL